MERERRWGRTDGDDLDDLVADHDGSDGDTVGQRLGHGHNVGSSERKKRLKADGRVSFDWKYPRRLVEMRTVEDTDWHSIGYLEWAHIVPVLKSPH